MIAERLKTLRKRTGMSQQEIAEKIGIEQNSYGRYEQGSRIPTTDIIVKIAQAFGVTVEEIYGNKPSEAVINKKIITTAELLQQYFKDKTGRNPTPEEFKVIDNLLDTYIKGMKK